MITALLHTRNRPGFVVRCLRFYSQWYRHSLILLDASDDEQFSQLELGLAALDLPFPLRILRHSSSTPFWQRFADALALVSTPYVGLMADDDFHYQKGMEAEIAHLEGHRDCSVAYGHVIHFELESYSPSGNVQVRAPRLDPLARWLEDDSPVERLAQLAKGPWRTTGWYAVQRTALFASIVRTAENCAFSNEIFERSMNLLQPIHAKVAKLDTICLARQANPQERRKPWTYRGNEATIALLEDVASDQLAHAAQMDRAEARRVVANALDSEVRQLRHNDRAEWLKATTARLGLSSSYDMLLRARRQMRSGLLEKQARAETRLPAYPFLTEGLDEWRLLVAACR
jgi:glycosyltransferase domain-containing protein